ncbi:AMIN-like domain-containing (lipo)protein [Demequina soli]|uniref:AMIN-like domain-containing (lipo)protein n=1 Tax=Demequina soli TaxID=1638987 RepID=UPI0007802834|nr:hypothetical protein [Demequina soli]
MRAGWRWSAAVIVTAALLTGCSSTPGPVESRTPSAVASASPTPAPSPTATPTPATTASSGGASACEGFGTADASTSSADWSSQLRTAPGEALWGVTMRVGTHDCYDRWVFELTGPGSMPGWSVTPIAASTFPGDGSGEDFSPDLQGGASLDVAFGAWFDGSRIDHAPYKGPRQILTGAFPAIQEARIVGAFEGITHVGIGLDKARPYKVTWLTDPKRLVIDIFTG